MDPRMKEVIKGRVVESMNNPLQDGAPSNHDAAFLAEVSQGIEQERMVPVNSATWVKNSVEGADKSSPVKGGRNGKAAVAPLAASAPARVTALQRGRADAGPAADSQPPEDKTAKPGIFGRIGKALSLGHKSSKGASDSSPARAEPLNARRAEQDPGQLQRQPTQGNGTQAEIALLPHVPRNGHAASNKQQFKRATSPQSPQRGISPPKSISFNIPKGTGTARGEARGTSSGVQLSTFDVTTAGAAAPGTQHKGQSRVTAARGLPPAPPVKPAWSQRQPSPGFQRQHVPSYDALPRRQRQPSPQPREFVVPYETLPLPPRQWQPSSPSRGLRPPPSSAKPPKPWQPNSQTPGLPTPALDAKPQRQPSPQPAGSFSVAPSLSRSPFRIANKISAMSQASAPAVMHSGSAPVPLSRNIQGSPQVATVSSGSPERTPMVLRMSNGGTIQSAPQTSRISGRGFSQASPQKPRITNGRTTQAAPQVFRISDGAYAQTSPPKSRISDGAYAHSPPQAFRVSGGGSSQGSFKALRISSGEPSQKSLGGGNAWSAPQTSRISENGSHLSPPAKSSPELPRSEHGGDIRSGSQPPAAPTAAFLTTKRTLKQLHSSSSAAGVAKAAASKV